MAKDKNTPRLKEPFRVLFVCAGNTCRSPIAEGILKKLLAEAGVEPDEISVASAGTMGIIGDRSCPMIFTVG